MKNNKKINLLLLVISSFSLIGCNNKTTINPEYIDIFLNQARQSYTLKSKEIETLKKEDDSTILTNEYQYEVKNITSINSRISQKYTVNVGGESYTSTLECVKDNKGYASKETINYKNEIITKPILEGNKKVIYDNEFLNPFLLIEKEDFIKQEEGIYSLKENKRSLFSYYLYSNNLELKDLTFTFENEQIKNIKTTSNLFEGVYFDKNINEYIPIKYDYQTTILLSSLGTTTIEGLKPVSSRNKEKENILKEALNELKGNYTIIINEHDREQVANPEYNTIWYFNGKDKVYHQQDINDTSRRYDLYYKADQTTFNDTKLRYHDFNEKTLTWEYNKPIFAQSYNSDPKEYDWFISKTQDVAPELFMYDEKENKYVCDIAEANKYLGNNFLPGCFKISYFTLGQGDKCEITLDSNNKVKSIVVGYSYQDTQGFDLATDFEMNFVNINKTEIPSWVEGA